MPKYKCQRGCGENGNFVHCWWECRLVQQVWKTVWSFLKNIKNRTALGASNSTSGDLAKETQNINLKELKEFMHRYVHCTVIYNSQDMEAT